MLIYFKLLELFILRTLFNKDEYNFKSKFFNPIKLFSVGLLFIGFLFSFFLLNKLSDAYLVIKLHCPNIAKDIDQGIPLEEIIKNYEKKETTCT